MSLKMNKSIKFWDRLSNRLDKPVKKLNETSFKTVESTKKYLTIDNVVLDYGCGPGTLTMEFAENIKTIHAIDISSGMIDVAKRKSAEHKIKNINFEHSDLFDEYLGKESFNVALAFNVLHYISDKQEVMQRINDLLKPGGLFISSTACLGERNSFLSMLMLIMTKIGIIPEMKFYNILELENLIIHGNFIILAKENLSRLPDCFIVAKKPK